MSKRKVACPYYRNERRGFVMCCGPGRKGEIKIDLNKRKQRKRYTRAFCRGAWGECLLARSIEKMEKGL